MFEDQLLVSRVSLRAFRYLFLFLFFLRAKIRIYKYEYRYRLTFDRSKYFFINILLIVTLLATYMYIYAYERYADSFAMLHKRETGSVIASYIYHFSRGTRRGFFLLDFFITKTRLFYIYFSFLGYFIASRNVSDE